MKRSLKTDLDMKAIGMRMDLKVEWVNNSGSMDLFTKVIGHTIKQMAEVGLFTLTEMSMMATGMTIKLTVLVCIITPMEQNMKVSGTRTSSMELAKRFEEAWAKHGNNLEGASVRLPWHVMVQLHQGAKAALARGKVFQVCAHA